MAELDNFGSDVITTVTDRREGQALIDLLIKYSVEKDETYRFITPDNEKAVYKIQLFWYNNNVNKRRL